MDWEGGRSGPVGGTGRCGGPGGRTPERWSGTPAPGPMGEAPGPWDPVAAEELACKVRGLGGGRMWVSGPLFRGGYRIPDPAPSSHCHRRKIRGKGGRLHSIPALEFGHLSIQACGTWGKGGTDFLTTRWAVKAPAMVREGRVEGERPGFFVMRFTTLLFLELYEQTI